MKNQFIDFVAIHFLSLLSPQRCVIALCVHVDGAPAVQGVPGHEGGHPAHGGAWQRAWQDVVVALAAGREDFYVAQVTVEDKNG